MPTTKKGISSPRTRAEVPNPCGNGMKKELKINSSSGRKLSAKLEAPGTGGSAEPGYGGSGVVVFAHCFTCGKDLRGAREK